MKWLLFFAFIALLCSAMAQQEEYGSVDYTDRYAELASPVPAHVNVDELVASLRAAGGQ